MRTCLTIIAVIIAVIIIAFCFTGLANADGIGGWITPMPTLPPDAYPGLGDGTVFWAYPGVTPDIFSQEPEPTLAPTRMVIKDNRRER